MSNLKPRTCRQCGVVFDGGPRAWYCPSCRLERRRKVDRDIKRNGAKRPLGSTDTCTVCGAHYTVNSGLQKYCPNCAPDAIKAVDREQGLEWYQNNAGTYNPARNQK